MITDPQLMPDFRDGLEQALYRRASLPAPLPERRRLPAFPRLALGGRLAMGAVVLIAALAVILTSLPGRHPSTQAFGGPLLLAEPTEAVPAGIEPGRVARRLFGADATYEGAIPFAVPGGTAYALKSRGGWCLSLPAASSADGASVQCTTTAELRRVGLITFRATGGGSVVATALVPPNAAPPTAVAVDGTSRVLPVSALGVVSASLDSGDHIVLPAKNGDDADVAIP